MPIGWLPDLMTADVVMAYRTSNWLSGKLIVILLLGASVLAWTVMVSKYRELKRAQRDSLRFQSAFRRETNPLAVFVRQQDFPHSPVYQVYAAGCTAIGAELAEQPGANRELFVPGSDLNRVRLSPLQIEVVRRVAERTVADQALVLEDRMGFLMTAVSASPLLGLLGTVWGVLDAFAAMAMKGMANLSAVAPGISGALLTTVVGLLVALPSSIGYNLLAGRIRHLAVQMDNFSQEFIAELQRAYMSPT
jgi:biopolymer transport protein ExbB/TolQ